MDKSHLKRLIVFAQVIRSGSFTAAAKQLSLPRSSVSEHVKTLESALGVRLVQRTTRKISLTSEGRAVYARAQSIQTLVDEIDGMALKRTPSGVVNISMTQDIARTWLIPILPEFYRRYPDIVINIIANDFISDLVHEQIDLALRVTSNDLNSSFIGRALGEERLRPYANSAYINQFGEPTSVDDLARFRWIMLQQTSSGGSITIKRGRKSHSFKPIDVYQTNSPELQRCMMEQGMGVGMHLPSLAKNSVENGLLQPIMGDYHSTRYSINLVYPSRQLPPRTRVLVDYLITIGWNHTSC